MELRIVRGAVSSMPSQPSFVRTPVSAIAADGVRALRCHHVSNLRVGESLRFTGCVWKWGTPCMPSKKCQFTRGNGVVYHDSPGVTLGVPGEFCLENDAKPLDFEGFSGKSSDKTRISWSIFGALTGHLGIHSLCCCWSCLGHDSGGLFLLVQRSQGWNAIFLNHQIWKCHIFGKKKQHPLAKPASRQCESPVLTSSQVGMVPTVRPGRQVATSSPTTSKEAGIRPRFSGFFMIFPKGFMDF